MWEAAVYTIFYKIFDALQQIGEWVTQAFSEI